MKSIMIGITISLMLIAVSCSTISVKHDYDSTVDFAKLKSFYWMPVPIQAGINTLDVKRIQSAITTQLQAKGYSMMPDNPDFMIAMHLGKQHKIEVHEWGYAYGPRGRYVGPGGIDMYQYDEGTLLLDFVDTRSKDLIWRGVATGEVDRYSSSEKKDKRINEAVQKILNNFPPTK